MGQETRHGFPLGLAEMAEIILHALEVRHIGKKSLRVHQVLVHIVEIGKDDFPPEDELIQRFSPGEHLPVSLIQLKEQADAVCNITPVHPVEEIIDCQADRSAERTSSPSVPDHLAQIFPEKHGGTPVREDETTLPDPACVIIMRGHLLQERDHIV